MMSNLPTFLSDNFLRRLEMDHGLHKLVEAST